MQFSKISVTKKGVKLHREETEKGGAVETRVLKSPERPLPTFDDALQAFAPYVVDLLEIPDEWRGALKVTTLNLSQDKNQLRGLIVTVIKPVAKAYDKPLVLNTPLVREGGENASEDAFVLSDEVLGLIKLAEVEARRYVKRERLQAELFGDADAEKVASENTKNFDERAAAAEVASTRKNGRKPKSFVRGVGDVMNADATVVLNDLQVRQLLLSVERDVPVEAIARWTSSERARVVTWGRAKQKKYAHSLKPDEKVPKEPKCVAEAATPSLADKWTEDPPPRVSDDAARATQAAARERLN